jgi:hypothetical protein
MAAIGATEDTTASGAATATDLLERELPQDGWSVDVPATREPADDLVDTESADDTEDTEDHEPGRIVRRKEHDAIPMTVDDALSQMELVGHDFFLFSDKATGRPSVVYRRHGYAYGVIALV